MKRLSIIMFAFLCAGSVFAQDRVITKDGDVFEAYRIDIGGTYVYYTKEDKDDATLQKIAKADVLMVKKKDGTKIDVTEYVSNAVLGQTAKADASNEQPDIIQVKPEDLSAEAKAANDALIEKINGTVEFYFREKEQKDIGKKEANSAVACFGVSPKSLLCNEDIEICVETGKLYKTTSKSPAIWKKDGLTSVGNWGGYTRGVLNPAIQFVVKNKSAQTVYIDLAKTFYVNMGQFCTYYIPSSTTTATTSSVGVGVNLGAVTGALGIGGAAGFLANGINVGGGVSNQMSSTTYSLRVIALAPMSSYSLSPQYFFGNETRTILPGLCYGQWGDYSYRKCAYINFSPNSQDGLMMLGDHYVYTEEKSPIQFSFYIAYSKEENGSGTKILSSFFYLKDLIGRMGGYGEPTNDAVPCYGICVTNYSGDSFPKQ